jgi:hypothetical protein
VLGATGREKETTLTRTFRQALPWASLTIVTSLLVVSLIATGASPQPVPSDALRRLTADTLADGFEVTTNAAASSEGGGGLTVFRKRFRLSPPDANVAYVTISATGDTHSPSPGDPTVDSSALLLACRFDGVPCEPDQGSPISTTPSGWVNLLKEPVGSACNDGGGGGGDCHDNAIHYTWCVPKELKARSAHRVRLKLASGGDTPGGDVFMEQINVFVDASFVRTPNKCTEFNPPAAAGEEVPPPQP